MRLRNFLSPPPSPTKSILLDVNIFIFFPVVYIIIYIYTFKYRNVSAKLRSFSNWITRHHHTYTHTFHITQYDCNFLFSARFYFLVVSDRLRVSYKTSSYYSHLYVLLEKKMKFFFLIRTNTRPAKKIFLRPPVVAWK